MNLDIQTAVNVAVFFVLAGVVISIFVGVQTIRAGQKLLFFRKRRDLMVRGWRLIFLAVFLAAIAFALSRYAEPVVYQVFPPSPTITITPTVTSTATVTVTPTITMTPTITPTISITPSPYIPTGIFLKFTSVVTPNPDAVFSRPVFAKEISKDNQPVSPQVEFANPVGKIFGAYSFDKMNSRSQWTALWVRSKDQQVLCVESGPWLGSTGGYGYSECAPPADQWLPGDYEMQIFVGIQWKGTGRFKVVGNPPPPPSATGTSTPSRTPLPTSTITLTPTPSLTPTPFPPTWTPIPSDTRWPSQTPTVASSNP